MRRILLLTFYSAVAALILCCAAMAHGQTISPLITECGRKCSNEFSIKNNGLAPLTVTLQPYSIALDAKTGRSLYRPLDTNVDLRLEEMSARLGPQAAHTFGWKLRCDEVPCQVAILATMTVGHTEQGIAVRIALPEVIYQCEKAKNCRAGVRRMIGLTK